MHTSHVNSTQTYVARQPSFCSSRVPAHTKTEPSHSREPKLRSHTAVEGKNRQVRRMTAAIGFPTLRLLRARIGNFSLAGLKPGAWKELDSRERRQLMP